LWAETVSLKTNEFYIIDGQKTQVIVINSNWTPVVITDLQGNQVATIEKLGEAFSFVDNTYKITNYANQEAILVVAKSLIL
jgi:ribosomal protein S11